jgi:hypothetical protein
MQVIEDTTPMSNQNKRATKKDLAGQAEQTLKCSKLNLSQIN